MSTVMLRRIAVAARSLASGAPVLALLLAAGTSQAQIAIHRPNIPDVDQRRDGLANNGNNHCVPTSFMNTLLFAANHGWPLASGIHPGPHDWSSQANVQSVTDDVYTMGVFMGTSGSSGTTGSGGYNGATLWLALFGGGNFTITQSWVHDNFVPSPFEMYIDLSLGALPTMCYGRYSPDAQNRLMRTGGHCLTVTGTSLLNAAGNWRLRFADPAQDDGDIFQQSPFMIRFYDTGSVSAKFIDSKNNVHTYAPFKMFGAPNDGIVRYFDGTMTLWPAIALTSPPVFGSRAGDSATGGGTSPPAGLGKAQINMPANLTYIPVPTTSTLDMDSIFDAEIAPSPSSIFLSSRGEKPGVYEFHRADCSYTKIGDAQMPGRITTSPRGEIYVLDGDHVSKFLSDPPSEMPGTHPVAQAVPPDPYDVAYDDTTDTLVVLSRRTRSLERYDRDLNHRASMMLPGETIPGDGSRLTVGPDGGFWLADPALHAVRHLMPSTDGRGLTELSAVLLLPAVLVEAVQADDRGNVIIVADGEVQAFTPDADGRFVPDRGSLWAGMKSGHMFKLSRNRTAGLDFLPPEGDFNVFESLPGELVPAVAVDYNYDGNINPDDLGDFITDYFILQGTRPCVIDPRLDYNLDGSVNPDDLGDFITDYFAI